MNSIIPCASMGTFRWNLPAPQRISLDNKTGFGYSDEYGFADGASNRRTEADTQFPIFDLSAHQ
jgi:hypothetical protein